MSEKLLEISGLSVCYEGEQILNNICFSVEKGETVGIAGESGSGKSTLLRAILRLMGKNGSITGGQITFRGEELTGMSEKKLRSLCGSEIGMIFQNTGASLCPTRKIGAQICESVRAHEKRCGFITPISGGMSGRKSRREIKDMTLQRFADMGLSDGETIWNSYPSSLSGGMNQRSQCCCIHRFFWRTSRRVHSMWFRRRRCCGSFRRCSRKSRRGWCW